MAFIYRYQLRDADLRENTSLTQYNQEIQAVIQKRFGENLKDILVEEKYFEFRLYTTTSAGVLRNMGRKLKASIPKYGFERMEQTLYALVYSSQDELKDNTQKYIDHIELIDSMLLDKYDLFMQRANSFFDKTRKDLQLEKVSIDNIEDVIKNYYIDILEAYIEKRSTSSFSNSNDNDNTNDVRCFWVKGFQRRIENNTKINNESKNNRLILESCFDVGSIAYSKENISVEGTGQSNLDYLEINVVEERPELVRRIKNELRLHISRTESIKALEIIKENLAGEKNNYVFKVHNVGQALASSVSYKNYNPLLYFDYGMPIKKQSLTRPNKVDMPTDAGITIILSHVHKDHWFRLAEELNAYQCHWYIPNQPIKCQLNHKLAEIVVHGGTVQMIDSDVVFPFGKITCAGCSKIDPVRAANHVHETGLTLRIQAHDTNGKELNILIAGDQSYDYVVQNQLDDLDILVASHHGGEYCWSTHGCVPTARNIETSTIIYSYGDGNTYHHPDKEDYIKANWIQEYHTKYGDYMKDIYI